VPKWAAMPGRHDIPILPSPLTTEATDDELRVRLPDGTAATFSLLFVPSLTRRTVADVLHRAAQAQRGPIFISYRQGSAEARQALRDADISFAGADGRAFLRAPGIFVDLDERSRPAREEALSVEQGVSVRNPFAKRSSRIPRWLLLNHGKPFSIGELANAVDLNPAAASRVVRALEDSAFVHEAAPDAGGRRRNIRLDRPHALLEAWLPLWQRRRIRNRHWDIGARSAEEAISMLSKAAHDESAGWSVGGLAGAAMIRRAVEPADVLIWTSAHEVDALAHILQPEPARGGQGTVRIALAPDPWTLALTRRVEGLPVSDSVQLWLDCSSEGERALEAADAVAETAGWS
jgi:hypothetical protein